MSDPSLFASPLVRQAARNLHRLEVLTANPLWTDLFCRDDFWRAWRVMALTPDEAAAWLPALAFAVSCEKDDDVLVEFARWPLPEPLPTEARPWRDRLIRNWEQRPVSTEKEQSIRLFALVRLDQRAERLPEWLREAHRALELKPEDRRLRLAALASWRPRPGDRPVSEDIRNAVSQWVQFWKKLYRAPGSQPDGLLAAAALLHLAEAGWLPSGPSPERLREGFYWRVRQYPFPYNDQLVLRMLLSSIPADVSTPKRWRRDVTEWLELTHENVSWEKREAVWGMLAAWQRESVLERSGRGRLPESPRLLPGLARALECEWYSGTLLAMAGYIPGAVEVSAHPKELRAVVARWEALSQDGDWEFRLAAWVARWNLMRAGVLTAEEQARFTADYVDAIRSEKDQIVLLTLAQTRPLGSFPLDDWKRRLSDRNNECRLAAGLAIHGWLVDMASSEWRAASDKEASSEQRVASSELPLATRHSPLAVTRRQVRQALRRAGQEVTGTVAPFVNLPHDVLPDFRQLHEIETALAAGHLPPSPDAGMENRPAPRTVPARLPEAHPRTDPPSITGRTAGSEPPARHPFPEAVRYE